MCIFSRLHHGVRGRVVRVGGGRVDVAPVEDTLVTLVYDVLRNRLHHGRGLITPARAHACLKRRREVLVLLESAEFEAWIRAPCGGVCLAERKWSQEKVWAEVVK